MHDRKLHVIHLLVRSEQKGHVRFLLYPHEAWRNSEGNPFLTLPTKKTVSDLFSPYIQGTSVEEYVDSILKGEFGLADDYYAIEQELPPAYKSFNSPGKWEPTDYTIYPIDVWVDPQHVESLRARIKGEWWRCEDGVDSAKVSPTAREVFKLIVNRESTLTSTYAIGPEAKELPDAPKLLLHGVPARPSMDALARRWFSQNKTGVRHLPKKTIDEVLKAGNRAFNLRVADPYLRYQMQGVGFTWSFFTDKDKQDIHVHGAPVVEIYGILEGRMEIWWKPYYDRGTSAWSHRILDAGDWVEVDSLQCHIVRWLSPGKGAVFKAGPGPLAEVGKLGVKGKTPCEGCPCMKPAAVADLVTAGKKS